MLRYIRGYTIVEVLIIISVLGILSTIAVVSWSGVVTSSDNQARASDAKQWASTFDLYKSRYFAYPIMPTNAATPVAVCLGAVGSFPTSAGAPTGADKCGQYKTSGTSTSATTNSTLATEIAKVGKIPKNSHEDSGKTIIDSTYVGPIAYIKQSADSGTVTVTGRFIFFVKGTCSGDYKTYVSTDFTGVLTNLVPTTGNVQACYIENQPFTITL